MKVFYKKYFVETKRLRASCTLKSVKNLVLKLITEALRIVSKYTLTIDANWYEYHAMISKEHRKIMLFGYETQNGKSSSLWQNPKHFPYITARSGSAKGIFIPLEPYDYEIANNLVRRYDEWKATKRSFTEEEVLQGTWIKESDNGNSFLVKLHPDKTLNERYINDQNNSWQGSWELIEGVLTIKVSSFELEVVANKYSFRCRGRTQ